MNNPLETYFRQPSIYIKLPSGGKHYPMGAIEFNENSELAVYPMTAKDEIKMKTPDALLSGQSTVDVIKSCIPQIKDPWKVLSVDIDTILISIRIASYGDSMTVKAPVPKTNTMVDIDVSLGQVLDNLDKSVPDGNVKLDNGLTVQIRPVDYSLIAKQQLRVYDEQKILQAVTNSELDESEKIKRYTETFNKIANYSVDEMLASVQAVTVPGQDTVTDTAFIQEFITNMDVATSKEIKKSIDAINAIGKAKSIKVQSPDADVEKGAPTQFDLPLTFDVANFFA